MFPALSAHSCFLGLIPTSFYLPFVTNLIHGKKVEIATEVNFPNVASPDAGS